MTSKSRALLASLLLSTALAPSAQAGDSPADKRMVERGRYLIVAGGCNDCHTPSYPETAGRTPQAEWLTGGSVGFHGPWGMSYPKNLRLYVQDLSEAQWLARVRQPMLPPMPWFNLREMTDGDLTAMYRFIRTLGPAGTPAPAAVAPGVAATTPYIDFVPTNLPKQARAAH